MATRGAESAHASSISYLAWRLTNLVQLTTDVHKAYLEAAEEAFHGDIDYAMLVKAIRPQPKRIPYGLSKLKGGVQGAVSGNPEKEHVITSFVKC